MKPCNDCGEMKPLDQYYRRKAGGAYMAVCKPCHLAKQKRLNDQKRREDPQYFTKKSSRWREANPEKDRLQHVKRTYGLSAEEYQGLLDRQEHVCAICRDPFWKTPSVDHNHDTGAVRGLLCQRCNMLCGLAHDKPALLQAAINYLMAGVAA